MTSGIHKSKIKVSEEIKRIIDNLICEQCGKHYKLKTARSLKYLKTRKFCSLDCYHKSSNSRKGKFKNGHKSLNKSGKESSSWLGDDVGYSGLHSWVRRTLGSANKCQFCETKDVNRYEWASKEHKYLRDKNEWISLCCKCHRNYDKTFKK